MSHVASVKAYVVDLDALESAAQRCGFRLVRDAKTYGWFGKWVNDFRGGVAAVTNGHDPKTFGKCVHKLQLLDHQKGWYEIGLVPRLDGGPGFELLYDNWSTNGARLEQHAGKELLTLKNEYAAAAATRVLARKGFRVTRTVTKGVITLDAVN